MKFGEAYLTLTFEPVEKFLMMIFISLIISLSLKYWYLLSLFSFILYYQELHISFSSYMNFKYICYLFFNCMAHLLNYSDSKPAELLNMPISEQNELFTYKPLIMSLLLSFTKILLASILMKHIWPWNTSLPFLITFTTYKLW